LLPRSQQQSYTLVANVGVNVEDIAERNADYVGLIPTWRAFLADNFAKLEDSLQHVSVRFATTQIGQGARFWSKKR
jgi:hypothetical protein